MKKSSNLRLLLCALPLLITLPQAHAQLEDTYFVSLNYTSTSATSGTSTTANTNGGFNHEVQI